MFANAVGVLIAILLLFPALNRLGEWTYGRWIMVHMNLELYGWTSLPLVGFLFRVYGADRGPAAHWCRPVLWVWSAALGVGAFSWLSGHSSGKLFLDWSGYARVLFPVALLALWLLLAFALSRKLERIQGMRSAAAWAAKLIGLVVLLAVPFLIYIASSPSIYPPVNPDTGGPTGASQLESSLTVVAILLMLPVRARTTQGRGNPEAISIAWMVLIAESAPLRRTGPCRRQPSSSRCSSSVSAACWFGFRLRPLTMRLSGGTQTRAAGDWLFSGGGPRCLVTGWVFFLPGVLDHFKFTDGLVGHSFVAMAGFTSSLLIFVMVQLLGEDGWIFNRTRSFYLWNGSVIAYVVLMTIAGWREGFDPTFTIVPGIARNVLYTLRLMTGY